MGRTILGIIVGLVVGVAIIAIVESIGHIIFPPPEGVDLKDPEALKSIMKDIPVGAKISVLVAWGLGVFGGGSVARLISRGASPASWVVGAILLGFAALTMVQIPHPVWMVVGAVVVTLLGILAANAVIKSKT